MARVTTSSITTSSATAPTEAPPADTAQSTSAPSASAAPAAPPAPRPGVQPGPATPPPAAAPGRSAGSSPTRPPARAQGHGRWRRLLLLLVLASIVGVAGWWALTTQPWVQRTGPLVASGTLEADEVLVGTEVSGRILGLAREG